MHTDQKRFPRSVDKAGKAMGAISPFCAEALQLDQRAFRALLSRIRERDPQHQVVLMMQVENEMPSFRDYSASGLAAWQAPVPADLMNTLVANEATLSSGLLSLWKKNGKKIAGSWGEVFGETLPSERQFGAWFYGRYVDAVAKAGKEVLNLPMYCNSWRGESPSHHFYMDVFHAAAPNIDFMGPDLYMKTGFNAELDLTLRPWNNLVIPETSSGTSASARAWTAYGKYGVLYYGAYLGPEAEWTQSKATYAIMENMAPLLLKNKATDAMTGFHQEVALAGESWDESFQGSRLHLTATKSLDFSRQSKNESGDFNNLTGGETLGCGLVASSGLNTYVLVGSRLDLEWFPPPGKTMTLNWAESGRYKNGVWQKTGTATASQVEVKDGHILIHFPRDRATFAQFRCGVEIK